MSKIADKMFGNSPKMERDGEKMVVKKKAAEKEGKDTTGEAEDQGSGEAVPMMVRHAMERSDMHHAHERAHHMHDVGKHGDKKELHATHEKMMKDLHSRHEKEMGGKKEHTPEMGKEKA